LEILDFATWAGQKPETQRTLSKAAKVAKKIETGGGLIRDSLGRERVT